MSRCLDLVIFLAQMESIVCVYQISSLCVKGVAGIASHLFLEYLQISSSLFFRLLFMSKLVRNNTEVLFLSEPSFRRSFS